MSGPGWSSTFARPASSTRTARGFVLELTQERQTSPTVATCCGTGPPRTYRARPGAAAPPCRVLPEDLTEGRQAVVSGQTERARRVQGLARPHRPDRGGLEVLSQELDERERGRAAMGQLCVHLPDISRSSRGRLLGRQQLAVEVQVDDRRPARPADWPSRKSSATNGDPVSDFGSPTPQIISGGPVGPSIWARSDRFRGPAPEVVADQVPQRVDEPQQVQPAADGIQVGQGRSSPEGHRSASRRPGRPSARWSSSEDSIGGAVPMM